jgi:hypothetical protein
MWRRHTRLLVALLLVLWVIAGGRRSLAIERGLPRGAIDPYGTAAALGIEGVDSVWGPRLAAIRHAATLAHDAHVARAPALGALFLLFQLAHVWYPQPVAATAGGRRMGVLTALERPALVYVLDGVAPPRSGSPLVPVARVAPFTAFRVTR